MKLVHHNSDGVDRPVEIGYKFTHESVEFEVTLMPEPHKPSSSGRVNVKSPSYLIGLFCISEYYCQVFDMEWIEREDQGWMSPEDMLTKARQIVGGIRGYNVGHLNVEALTENMAKISFDDLGDVTNYELGILKKWLDEHYDRKNKKVK